MLYAFILQYGVISLGFMSVLFTVCKSMCVKYVHVIIYIMYSTQSLAKNIYKHFFCLIFKTVFYTSS